MELKKYQKRVIADLSRYLELLRTTGNFVTAFRTFWREKGVPLGPDSLPDYQNLLPGVPNLCFKVPTGGGKTFLACNAVRPVFDTLPSLKAKVVVWLVPSDSILEQTLQALKNPRHPYRQKLDVDFGGRVEVYSKQELLSGQNFNLTTVMEQLSVMVLSYDSFRSKGKEGLKAYQENSSLTSFSKALGKPEMPIEKADESALFQIINQLNPLVIVDESHHARTDLSLEMLKNFNPCFVLDLTATPRKESNIISFVDAVQLKRENMVKLPVIVYNQRSQTDVVADAIDLRRKLEELADMERTKTGNAIRPIVLFQAQPRGKEDSTTFEKLRCKLVEAGIPAEHIAIKTAETNELKNVDLLSDSCPVRYIITVNALKEGWDCPFAYILASLANRTSRVDVEQILGRILRLPYTRKNDEQTLNMSYVLTSSNDFRTTLDAIIKGLNSAGFSKRECRVASEALLPPDVPTPILLPLPTEASASTDADDDVLNVNPQELQRAIAERRTLDVSAGQTMSGADTMLQRATETGQDYEQAVAKAENEGQLADIPLEVKEKMTTYPMNAEYAEEALLITIPQFFYKVPRSLFIHGEFALLERAQLAKDFTLKGKAYDIDFSGVDDDIASIDVRDADGVPKVFKLSNDDQNYFKKYFHTLPPENKVKHCKDIIYNLINKLNIVSSKELRDYIERIVDDMNASQVAALEKAPLSHAEKIKNKIESLLVVHFKEEFKKCLEMEKIICKPAWKLPPSISPTSSTSSLGKSLYQAEEAMNGLEWEIVKEITGVPNIKWWHRNIAKHGFRINGYINHYPDLIIMTKSGRHILVEAKGHFLKNDDSRLKLELGQAWQKAAGSQYRYYMVFNDGEPPLEGALTLSSFIEILKEL